MWQWTMDMNCTGNTTSNLLTNNCCCNCKSLPEQECFCSYKERSHCSIDSMEMCLYYQHKLKFKRVYQHHHPPVCLRNLSLRALIILNHFITYFHCKLSSFLKCFKYICVCFFVLQFPVRETSGLNIDQHFQSRSTNRTLDCIRDCLPLSRGLENQFCNRIQMTTSCINSSLNNFHNESVCEMCFIKIKRMDEYAWSNYSTFARIMEHYSSLRDYSVKGNQQKCLDSYKAWTCAFHISALTFDNETQSCQGFDSPLSLCCQAEANCPFFRIGDKPKQLGAQAAFQCRGLGASDSLLTSSSADFERNFEHERIWSLPVNSSAPGRPSGARRSSFHVSVTLLTWLCCYAFLILSC